MTIKKCQPASISTLRDGAISLVFHVEHSRAAEAFDLHKYLGREVKLDIWVDKK